MSLPVTPSAVSGTDTTFADSTADGTAKAGRLHRRERPGIIPAGSTGTTISIPINNDNTYEGNETFTVTLSNPSQREDWDRHRNRDNQGQ